MKTAFVTSRKHDKKIESMASEIAEIEQKIETISQSIAMMVEREKLIYDFKILSQSQERIAEMRAEILNHRSIAERVRRERRDLEQLIKGELAVVLKQVNGRAVTYTLDADRVIDFARKAEEHLAERGINVRNRVGTEVIYRPAGQLIWTSYAAIAKPSITTRVVLKRVRDGWRLISAERDHCFVNQKEFKQMIIGPAANDNIIRQATNGFVVRNDVLDENS